MVLYCNMITLLDDDPDQAVAFEKQVTSLPHIALLDARGATLAIHEGARTVAGFQQSLDKARATQAELRHLQQAAKADPKAALLLLRRQLELGHLEADAASRALIKLLDLDATVRQELKAQIHALRITELTVELQCKAIDAVDAAEEFLALAEEGAVPDARSALFWYVITLAAERTEDPELLELAIEQVSLLKDHFGPDLDSQIQQLQGQLKRLRTRIDGG